MAHITEIDQSGKLEQLDTDTIVAFSNGKHEAICIKAGVKRKIIQHLRQTLIPHKDLYPIFFAITIFILIKSQSPRITLKIDEEYTGKENIIKETLEKLLMKQFRRKWQGIIKFGRIGKHSNAHKLAWENHRNKQRGKITRVTEKEVLKLLIL